MKSSKIWLVGVLIVILICSLTVGRVHAQRTLPDITVWMGSWFKFTITQNEFHFDSQVVKPTPGYQVPSSITAYLYINSGSWGPGPPESQMIAGPLYIKNSSGKWDINSYSYIDFKYFAGSMLKFVCTTSYDDGYKNITATFLFNGKLNISGKFINSETVIKTLGGCFTELDDVLDSTERWSGSFKMSGQRISLSAVPLPLRPTTSVYTIEGTTEESPEGSIIHKYKLQRTP